MMGFSKSLKTPFSLSISAGVFFLLIAFLIGGDFQWTETPTSSVASANSKYIVVIDAGSAGSRVHIYHFSTISESREPELVNEVFDYIIPGLSAYKNDPQAAARSLDPLLETAVESVPQHLLSTTPITVKATAGLRLIGKRESDDILSAVEDHLKAGYPFILPPEAVTLLDGKYEGVYAWIQVNQILGNIGHDIFVKDPIELKKTAGVFDLGGGSTQIVFEPNFASIDDHLEAVPGDHIYELSFGKENYTLYQHSHLGYGLMEARKTLHRLAVQKANGFHDETREINLQEYSEVTTPCLAPGQTKLVSVNIAPADAIPHYMSVLMVGSQESSGSSQCLELVYEMLNVDAYCPTSSCGFNGVHQPSLAETFADEDLHIFSYFYDRLYLFFGESSSPTLHEILDITNIVCQGPQVWDETLGELAIAELNERAEYCLDLSFIFGLLHHGYGIPLHRQLKVAKTIKGRDLGWTLGAALSMLDQVGLDEI